MGKGRREDRLGGGGVCGGAALGFLARVPGQLPPASSWRPRAACSVPASTPSSPPSWPTQGLPRPPTPSQQPPPATDFCPPPGLLPNIRNYKPPGFLPNTADPPQVPQIPTQRPRFLPNTSNPTPFLPRLSDFLPKLGAFCPGPVSLSQHTPPLPPPTGPEYTFSGAPGRESVLPSPQPPSPEVREPSQPTVRRTSKN